MAVVEAQQLRLGVLLGPVLELEPDKARLDRLGSRELEPAVTGRCRLDGNGRRHATSSSPPHAATPSMKTPSTAATIHFDMSPPRLTDALRTLHPGWASESRDTLARARERRRAGV